METNTRNAVRIIVNESFEEKGNVMAHLTDAEKDNVLSRPWKLDAEMDRLMKLDAEAFWENAHELPFDIGHSGDGNR